MDHQGIQADTEKTTAIKEMSQPENVSELRRFLGMINQMGKFLCNVAQLKPFILSFYDPNAATKFSADPPLMD